MERLLGAFATIGDTKVRWDDDFVDRLNHRYTTFLLVIFAIIVSTKQYVGEPINCWCPAQFTDNHEDFTNKICWVQNTYYVPISQKKIPEPDEKHATIAYYQWVPMILLIQAVLFYIPCMLWRFFNNKSGIDVNNIIEAAVTLQHGAYQEQRLKTIQYMTKHFDRYLDSMKSYKTDCYTSCKQFINRKCLLCCGRTYGNYVVFLYVTTKILYLINVIGQLFSLNAFLGSNYHAYGFDIMHNLLADTEWVSDRFPRVTLCDFNVRTLGNIHRHTVQCVLPINLFNEKIFIFLWFWFVFDALATLFNIFIWLFRCFVRINHYKYVKNHLYAMMKGKLPSNDKPMIKHFTQHYLRQDGIVVLRLIGMNANEIVVAELIKELWLLYKSKNPTVSKLDPSAPILEDGNGMVGREAI